MSRKNQKPAIPPQNSPKDSKPEAFKGSSSSWVRGRSLAHLVLMVLTVLVLYLAYKIIQPYLNTIILAVLLSSLWMPVHKRILNGLRNRGTIAAIVSCHLIVLVVILPLAGLTTALINQGINSFKAVQTWVQEGGLNKILNSEKLVRVKTWLETKLGIENLQDLKFSSTIIDGSKNIGQFLLAHGSDLVQNISSLVMKFFLMIFIMFFIFKEGAGMKAYLLHLLPLKKTHEEQLLKQIRAVSKSVLWGAMATAAAQGLAGGIGLVIVGIPPLFWGAMMGFASMIPVVGTALIWIPAAIYLLIIGSWGKAIFLTVWCVVVVGSIDNFLRPVLMKGEAGMSTLLLFFAIVGGLSYFGLIGIIYGPLIFGLCAVLLYIYELEFADFLTQQDRS